jgi:two-component system KDP operon response regulator KdpE
VVLDLGLPDADGKTVIAELRGWSQLPILMLSAREREEEKVAALDAGADDYLTKPFGVPELLARLRAMLRRRQQASATDKPGTCARLAAWWWIWRRTMWARRVPCT